MVEYHQSETVKELSRFQIELLAVANTMDEPSGQDIRRAYDELTGSDTNHGRLYPNLKELVELGCVTKGKHDDRTNYYECSDKGREALEAHAGFIGECL